MMSLILFWMDCVCCPEELQKGFKAYKRATSNGIIIIHLCKGLQLPEMARVFGATMCIRKGLKMGIWKEEEELIP